MLIHAFSVFLLASSVAGAPSQAGKNASAESFSTADGRVLLIIPDMLGQDREGMRYWLEESSESVLREYALPPIPPGQSPPWKIHIEAFGYAYTFSYSVTLVRSGMSDTSPPDVVQCKCTTEDFLKLIKSRMRELIDTELAREAAASTSVPTEPEVAPDASQTPVLRPLTPSAPTEQPPSGRRTRFGGFGIAGVVIVGASSVPFGFAIDRVIRDGERFDRNPGIMISHYRARDTHAAFGVGAAMVATGLALVLIDQLVCKKRPRGCRRSTPAVSETSLGWRF